MQDGSTLDRAKIIQQAIAVDADKGAAHAWAFLKFHDIPSHIAAQVLAESGQHRVMASAVAKFTADSEAGRRASIEATT